MTTTEHGELDRVSGHGTTGHEWDGIRELNTPLPRWWLWTFYACIVWSVGYWIVYPAWPMVSGFTRGMLGYSSRGDLSEDLGAFKARRNLQAKGLETAGLAEIKSDPKLLPIALAQGRAAFGDNCAPCHGAGGAGAKGYPNLADDDWLWGGKLEDIHTTITHGIRAANDQATRLSLMPAFGHDGLLKPQEIQSVANHVRFIAGLEPERDADLKGGGKIFAENCAVCHGAEGKGNPELGAPNLTDAIWFYGSDIGAITATVTNARNSVMPSWTGRLDPVTIKSLALYVHSLGGGQ
jgi:cytochrome c oxidase cbb3-type subunit III